MIENREKLLISEILNSNYDVVVTFSINPMLNRLLRLKNIVLLQLLPLHRSQDYASCSTLILMFIVRTSGEVFIGGIYINESTSY